MDKPISKSNEEWKKELTSEQYHICREKGTEAPFTGQYTDCKESGMYQCTCCGADLFDSKTKFDSGTGWPSFWEPVNEDSVLGQSCFIEDFQEEDEGCDVAQEKNEFPGVEAPGFDEVGGCECCLCDGGIDGSEFAVVDAVCDVS